MHEEESQVNPMNKPYQRKGVSSNTAVGKAFEAKAKAFFSAEGIELQNSIPAKVGINGKKIHKFDLGNDEQKILVECKSHRWTEGGNIPSAKIRAWNEAMYFFYIAPKAYRKIFFVLRDYSPKKKETLASFYVRTSSHLIPKDVEIWEYDEKRNTVEKMK